MNAIRQKIRPKHQLLILKCYPKPPAKSTTAIAPEEIKPNSSELSYLLYYASARRSKLTKVGTFLEKKTASDVYKNRAIAVQVTLQILAAFLRSPEVGGNKEGFGLFAPFVLRILREVLAAQGSGNVELVEACLPVWGAFCANGEHAAVASDTEFRALFSGVVRAWAELASKNKGKKRGSVSDESRLRKAGLEAMGGIVGSQALNSEPGRQMETVLGAILGNLWAENGSFLVHLDAREKEKDAGRGRPSMQTVRTTRTAEESDPRAAEGTAADADKIAEEEAGLLAMHCLKGIYQVDNRGQIRVATSALLAFIAQQEKSSSHSEKTGIAPAPRGSSWATTIVKMVCNWAPVQDRFVVLFTAVETLIRTPLVEEELEKQLVLSYIIGEVLASDINLIGLSIMDILLGLVQHVLLVLQIGTSHATLNPGSSEITSSDEDLKSPGDKRVVMELAKTPSPARMQLLAQLRQCIASLATHVYYTDQVSDMAAAILLRLKPSAGLTQHPSITASAIQDPDTAAAEVASNASLKERPNIDGFFSFDTAREVALNAVKDIMIVANGSRLDGNSTATNRNPVPISVWEGTQWLLRDSSDDVRRAYVDALCTWLNFETTKLDRDIEDNTSTTKSRKKENGYGNAARRAVSNASARNRVSKRGRGTFLQLLHLAVYEEALHRADAPDSDSEFLLLHLLLTTLSERLGINAVQTGLPMIFRLQEDAQQLSSPAAKIRIGSLVHGYLSSLTSIFAIDSMVKEELDTEIARRQSHSIWLQGLQIPALPVSNIKTLEVSSTTATADGMRAFAHREQFISALAAAYAQISTSPPASPPASPGRSFTLPILSDPSTVPSSTYLKPTPAAPPANNNTNRERCIPNAIQEELNAPWSKDNLLAALAANAPKSISLSGSRSGGTGLASQAQHGSRTEMFRATGMGTEHRHLLAAANTFPMTKSSEGSPVRSGSAGGHGHGPGAGSVRRAVTVHSQRSRRNPATASGRLNSRSPNGSPNVGAQAGGGRRASASTIGYGTRTSSIAGGAGSRLDELKRALATGAASGAGGGLGLGMGRFADDESCSDSNEEESMVDVDNEYASSYGGAGESNEGNGSEFATPPETVSPTGADTKSAPHIIPTVTGAEDSTNSLGLPDWSAAAMAELNSKGGGIHILNDHDKAPIANTAGELAAPPALNLSPATPLSLGPEHGDAASSKGGILGIGSENSASSNNASGGLLVERPTTAATESKSSRRANSRGRSATLNSNASAAKRDFSGLLDSIGTTGSEGEDMGRDAPPY